MLKKPLFLSFILGCSLVLAPAKGYSQRAAKEADSRLSPSFLTNFESYAEGARLAWQVPGMAIGIVKDNQTVFAKGFGVKELDGTEEVTPATLFEIGSISKSFTATLVAMMVDEGRLNWDGAVIDYLPDFILYDPWVTRAFQIQDLLAQRSGLAPHAGDGQVYFGATRQTLINHLRFIKPVSSFRSQYAYQNSFFVVAGEILKLVSGLSWEELVKERLFMPLGMKDSNTSLKDYKAYKDINQLHKRIGGQIKKLPVDYPYRSVYTTFGPAGGINSTIVDMTQWLKLQLNKGTFKEAPLVTKNNLQRLHKRYILTEQFLDSDNYYGLGLCIRDYSPYSIIWHDGGTAGFSSMMAFIPEENLGIVILTNASNIKLGHALALQFFDLYYRHSSRDWSKDLLEKQMLAERKEKEKLKQPVNPEPPLALDKYTGIYSNPVFGKVEVDIHQQKLHLTMGANHTEFLLEHWNRDSFELLWPALEEDGKMFITFTIDTEGQAAQFTIPSLDEGNNLFKRL